MRRSSAILTSVDANHVESLMAALISLASPSGATLGVAGSQTLTTFDND